MFMRPHSFGARVICAAGSRGWELQQTAVQTGDTQLLTLTRSEKKWKAQNCEILSSMFLWICMKCNAFNMSFSLWMVYTKNKVYTYLIWSGKLRMLNTIYVPLSKVSVMPSYVFKPVYIEKKKRYLLIWNGRLRIVKYLPYFCYYGLSIKASEYYL